MRALIGLILGIFFLLLGALFTGANDTLVNFDYLLGDFEWPVSYLLLSAFASGMGAALVLLLPVYLRWKSEKIQLQRKLKVQRKELDNLRTLPVQDNP